MNTISSAYLTNRNLFEFLCLKGFNLTLQYGVTDSSPYMLHSYAFALADKFGAFKSAYEFGAMAFALNKKCPNAQMRSKITAMFGFFFSHWIKPLGEGIDFVKKGFRYCVETGDLVFAGYSSCTLFLYMLAQGRNISEILAETDPYQDFVIRAEDHFSIDFHKLKNQFVKCLQGETEDRCSLSDGYFDETSAVQELRKQHNANLLFHYFTWKGQILFLQGRLDEACSIFHEGKQYAHGVALLPSIGDHVFYHALVMTILYPRKKGQERRFLRNAIYKNLKKLKKWSENCPENYIHKYLLVCAEVDRINGKQARSMDLFSETIETAREYGFLQVEALANERMALFHFSSERKPLGNVYIREAIKGYQRWGAAAKVEALCEEHGLSYAKESAMYVEHATPTSSASTIQFDLNAVIRASQTISEEIVLSKLLQDIMQLAIQNAGARKGFLLLEKEGSLFIEAQGQIDREEVEVFHSIPVESSRDLSIAIVNYVQRTKETVVLQNAFEEGNFLSDPYVVENRSKSILCIPVLKQKQLTGILYLENDLLTDAFTRDRIEVLSLLSSQAAISLENAKLYEDVENRVIQLQNAEDQIKRSLNEKEILLREIHHRVKNNMQIISSLLNLQSEYVRDSHDAAIFDDTKIRIKSMALIHEKLYQSRDLASVDFGDYIRDLTKSILLFYGDDTGRITIQVEAEGIWFGIDTAIPCGLIINELVSNAFKYAFPGGREGEIKIALRRGGNDTIELMVSDNGIGMPEELDFRNTVSLGLRLVTTLSEDQLRGTIEVNREAGTIFSIRFKEVKYKKRV
jgi:two-component sensor histidine kinase